MIFQLHTLTAARASHEDQGPFSRRNESNIRVYPQISVSINTGSMKINISPWCSEQPDFNGSLVISNHFLCKDLVHHPTEATILDVSGSRIVIFLKLKLYSLKTNSKFAPEKIAKNPRRKLNIVIQPSIFRCFCC